MEDTITKLRELLLSQSKAGRLRSLLDNMSGTPVSTPGLFGMQHQQAYSQTDPALDRYMAGKESASRGVPLEAPMFAPDDLIGSGFLKGMLGGGAALGGVIKGGDLLKMFPEFAKTKAATATGEPLMLHHGTVRQEPIQEFNRRFKPDVMKGKDSIDSIGTWFTNNPNRVQGYGTADYPSYANLQNPKVFNSFDELREAWKEVQTSGRRNQAYRDRMKLHSQNPHWGSSDEFVQEMRFDGHDGVIVKQHGSGEWKDQDAYIVFDPQNIKSAISP
jgi:hypothetical protein